MIQTFERFQTADADVQALFTFAGAYIVSHEILAHTAWASSPSVAYSTSLAALSDSNIRTLTGCSRDLLKIVSEISSLASDIKQGADSAVSEAETLRQLNARGDILERQLHSWPPSHEAGHADESLAERSLVAEMKRLTALLYLYSRTRHLGPNDACIVRLTSRILRLIPQITLRTNTVLWPLFMVATLGVRPESDADRAVVLGRLDSLQRTRQLGNVKKARQIIESVWKMRDLRESVANLAWGVLQLASGPDRISLA